jgi:2,4-dienoyl-CoA reductase-like NADH-dependent reductase (Old Yellow Enzyme family)
MSLLFSPLQIKDVTLKNRIVVSPMCQYSSADGFANDWHLVHLGSRAVGGAALVIQEASAVSPGGRITYGDMGIWKDEHIPKLKQITGFIHANGSVAGIQLAHAGRKASTEKPWLGGRHIAAGEHHWQTVAPSPIPFGEGDAVPHELTTAEIAAITEDFRQAAIRALEAGYKVVEIHAAHGYLIHQFLSPLSNARSDEYGGSFEARTRLLLEIVAAVQTVWPAGLPLWVRISATDWVDDGGGWSLDDSVQLCRVLKERGVDVVDVSSGGAVPYARITAGPATRCPLRRPLKAGRVCSRPPLALSSMPGRLKKYYSGSRPT